MKNYFSKLSILAKLLLAKIGPYLVASLLPRDDPIFGIFQNRIANTISSTVSFCIPIQDLESS